MFQNIKGDSNWFRVLFVVAAVVLFLSFLFNVFIPFNPNTSLFTFTISEEGNVMTVVYGIFFSTIVDYNGVPTVEPRNIGVLDLSQLDTPTVNFVFANSDKIWFTLKLTSGQETNDLWVLYLGIFMQYFLLAGAAFIVTIGIFCNPRKGCANFYLVLLLLGSVVMFVWDIIVICLANNWINNGFNVPGAKITEKGPGYTYFVLLIIFKMILFGIASFVTFLRYKARQNLKDMERNELLAHQETPYQEYQAGPRF